MLFNLITLFPEFFNSPLSCGLLSKAIETGLISFNSVNPRTFSQNKHKSVDDRPYGGGPGMVMTLRPVLEAVNSLNNPGRILLLSPGGRPFSHSLAASLSREEALTIICGRYEGLDARVEKFIDLEAVSLGDFVLNGGEAAALCIIEAVSRLLKGFMGKQNSALEESFSSNLLEYPHYSRPENYQGHPVPETLLSGDHVRIAAWRRKKSLMLTLKNRPDLLNKASITPNEAAFLGGSSYREQLGRNMHLALVHHPVLDRFGNILTSSLTNLDIHDIARNSRCYGLRNFYVLTPLVDQRAMLEELLDHWTADNPGRINPDRAEALALVKTASNLDQILEDIRRICGQRPRLLATSAKATGRPAVTTEEVRGWLRQGPVLMLLGTSWGLAPEIIELSDGTLRPIRFMDHYNHLPVRSAAAIMLDRIIGDIY